MEGCQTEVRITRGSTVEWFTNFYDPDGDAVNPASAEINIVYPKADGTSGTETAAMTPPGGSETRWTASWDSRVSAGGTVYWSIKSDPGPPMGVEDGQITLTANPANTATT